jgi:hypothetical protein
MIAPQPGTAPLPAQASRRRPGFALRLRQYGNSQARSSIFNPNNTMVSTTLQAQVRQQPAWGPAWLTVLANSDARKSETSTFLINYFIINISDSNIYHNLPHFSTQSPQFSTFLRAILHRFPHSFHTSPHIVRRADCQAQRNLACLDSWILSHFVKAPL